MDGVFYSLEESCGSFCHFQLAFVKFASRSCKLQQVEIDFAISHLVVIWCEVAPAAVKGIWVRLKTAQSVVVGRWKRNETGSGENLRWNVASQDKSIIPNIGLVESRRGRSTGGWPEIPANKNVERKNTNPHQ